MNDKQLLWFMRFLFVPDEMIRAWYPYFKHKCPDAIFALEALEAMGDD